MQIEANDAGKSDRIYRGTILPQSDVPFVCNLGINVFSYV